LVSFMQVSDDHFQEESWLCLETVIQKPAWNLPVSNVQ